jgi:hypothetical protein
MSKTSADRRLGKGNLANLYTGNSELGWRIVKQVPITLGLKRVAKLKWWLFYFEDGGFAGFLIREGPERSIPDGMLPGWSGTAITAKESQINAGLCRPSQTIGLASWIGRTRALKRGLT